jgi:hypothetical protein
MAAARASNVLPVLALVAVLIGACGGGGGTKKLASAASGGDGASIPCATHTVAASLSDAEIDRNAAQAPGEIRADVRTLLVAARSAQGVARSAQSPQEKMQAIEGIRSQGSYTDAIQRLVDYAKTHCRPTKSSSEQATTSITSRPTTTGPRSPTSVPTTRPPSASTSTRPPSPTTTPANTTTTSITIHR